jgi:hypothetical protein
MCQILQTEGIKILKIVWYDNLVLALVYEFLVFV